MPMATKEAQREYARQWIAKRRAEWLTANGPCCQCGSWDNLEIDHVDRAQKVTHTVWSWRQERRDTELAKCQVLCHSCHCRKTLSAGDHLRKVPRPKQTTFRHGTLNGYTRWKCRCVDCREAKRVNHGDYYTRRQADPARRIQTWKPAERTMSRICQTCSKQFLATPGEVKRGRAKFCNEICYRSPRRESNP